MEGLLVPLGSLFESFWSLLGDFWATFWGLRGFVEIDAPLKRKPTF